MTDLFAPTFGAEPAITLGEEIRAVEREIAMRRRVYPRWVEIGRMKQGMADREIAAMESVLGRLRAIQENRP